MQERVHRTILCAWKSLHTNIKFVKPCSKLVFLKINLHFDTSDKISTNRKYLKNFLITSKYLVFFSLEMQRRLVQTKVYYKLCYSVSKETSHKPFKVAAAENSFPNIIDTTWFRECFLFCMITRRHYSLHKFIVNQRSGENAMLLCSVK